MNISGHDVFVLWLFYQGEKQIVGIYSNAAAADNDRDVLNCSLKSRGYCVVEDRTVRGESVYPNDLIIID